MPPSDIEPPSDSDPSRSTADPKGNRPPSDRPPSHIHDRDAKTTRCGIKMNRNDRFPYVAAEHAATHIKGWGMTICPQCAEVQ